MRRQRVWGFMLALVLGMEALAATPGFVWYTGKDQGPIPGSNPFEGKEGASTVLAYYQTFSANPNPADCLPDKGNQSSPLTIVKEIDTASTHLLKAFRNREPLEVILRLYRTTPEGTQENYFTITLKNALVTGIRQEFPLTQDPRYMHYTHLERVSFTYREIVWDHIETTLDTGMEWEARCDVNPFSDLNFDGAVNILDFSIMADEWLRQGYF